MTLDRPTLQAIRDAAIDLPSNEYDERLAFAWERLASAADCADAMLARREANAAKEPIGMTDDWLIGEEHGAGFTVEWKRNRMVVLKSPGIAGRTATLCGTTGEEFLHLFQRATTEAERHAVVMRYLHP